MGLFSLRLLKSSHLLMPAVLLGCVNLQDLPKPPPPSSPSDGLTKDSYGRRLVRRDADGNPSPIPLCQRGSKYDDVNELSRKITAFITSPLRSLEEPKIDSRIKAWELAKHFTIAADITGGPLVTVVDYRQSEISFWHIADAVPLPEVSSAATDFCARRAKNAVYVGTATKCGTPKDMRISINGERVIAVETNAISEFRCQ